MRLRLQLPTRPTAALARKPLTGGRFGGRFDRYKSTTCTVRADARSGNAKDAPGGGRHYTFGLRKRNRGYEDRRNMGREIRKKIIAWDTAPDEEFFKELRRVSRNQIIWGANYFPNMPPTRCFVVWRKLTISEDFSMAMAEYAWTSFNGNAKVYECAPQGKPGDERFHPTQKPVALYSWLLRRFWTGGVVFDPMMGSQSSRIAAHFAGADFVGCELDPEYFAKGNARFDAATRQLLLPLFA